MFWRARKNRINYKVKYNQCQIKVLTEVARFEHLNADTADKTKICHDKICPSILSRQFQLCSLVRIGPWPNTTNLSKILSFGVGCSNFFSVFGYSDETLSLVFDILRQVINSTLTSWFPKWKPWRTIVNLTYLTFRLLRQIWEWSFAAHRMHGRDIMNRFAWFMVICLKFLFRS